MIHLNRIKAATPKLELEVIAFEEAYNLSIHFMAIRWIKFQIDRQNLHVFSDILRPNISPDRIRAKRL